jgi:hypothetical protein
MHSRGNRAMSYTEPCCVVLCCGGDDVEGLGFLIALTSLLLPASLHSTSFSTIIIIIIIIIIIWGLVQ